MENIIKIIISLYFVHSFSLFQKNSLFHPQFVLYDPPYLPSKNINFVRKRLNSNEIANDVYPCGRLKFAIFDHSCLRKQAFDESFGRIMNVSTTKRRIVSAAHDLKRVLVSENGNCICLLLFTRVHKADGLLPRRGKLIFPVLTRTGLSSAQRNDP